MKKKIISMLLAIAMMIGTTTVYAMELPDVIEPSDVYSLEDGTLIFVDNYNKSIWQQDASGETEKITGNTTFTDSYGDPAANYKDGSLDVASFKSPWAITPYLNGYAVSDPVSHTIRYIDMEEETVTTAVGYDGRDGFSNSKGTKSRFDRPMGLATMSDGSILVADANNNLIRKIDTKGNVSTFAGSDEGDRLGSDSRAQFREPTDVWCDENDVVYVADTGNNRICKIENGEVSLVSGKSTFDDGGTPNDDFDDAYVGGFQNGNLESAMFSGPMGVYSIGDTIYVSDTGNSAIRMIKDGVVSTIAIGGGTTEEFNPIKPIGLVYSSDTLWVADTFGKSLFSVDLSAEAITPDLIFNDVTENDWYYNSVQFLNNIGAYDGMTEFVKTLDETTGKYVSTFNQDDLATRSMFVYALAQYEYSMRPNSIINGNGSFTDVLVDDYFTNATKWAVELGITTGTSDEMFSPDMVLTRAQCVTFLYRYANYLGVSETVTNTFSEFADGDTVPGWATESMAWAIEEGIIQGKPGQLLAPDDALSRAEMATMLSRFGY